MTRILSLAFTVALLASSAVGCVVSSSRTEFQIEVFWDNSLGSYTDCTTAVVDDGTDLYIYPEGGATPVVTGRYNPCADTILIDSEDDGSRLDRFGYDIVISGRAADGTTWYSNCGTVYPLSGVVNIVECDADISPTEIQIEAYWDNSVGNYTDCTTAVIDDGTDFTLYPAGSAGPVVTGSVFPCADTILLDQENDGSALTRDAYDIELEGYALDGTEWYADCGTIYPIFGAINVIECDVPITFP